MTKRIYSLLFLVLLPCGLYAKGDPVIGEIKAEICMQCHEPDGTTADPIVPKLNGQNQAFLYRNAMQYNHGERYDIVMKKVINKIRPSAEDIADITAYYSSLPIMTGNGIITAEGERGRDLFGTYNCRFCHNDEDRSKGIYISKTAVIGGQNKEYLYKSLKDIQEGIRKADQFNLMERVLNKMTDDDIGALSEYLSSL